MAVSNQIKHKTPDSLEISYSSQEIEHRIFTIRGTQVMLDRDLAELYQIKTIALNQAVKRNAARFPESFRFQLTASETEELITKCDRFQSLKHSSSTPYAFTEQGVAMLSAVLRSDIAVRLSVQIIEAFVAMRRFMVANAGILQRLDSLEQFRLETKQEIASIGHNFDVLLSRLDEGTVTPKEAIFFEGEFFEARVLLEQIIKTAKKRVIIIDGYVDAATFEMLDVRAKGVTADVYSDSEYKTLRDSHNASKGKQPVNTHKWSKSSHDRWVIIDDTLYHCGHSVKDLGKKLSAIMKMDWNPEDILKQVK